jgi:hypothetical protein
MTVATGLAIVACAVQPTARTVAPQASASPAAEAQPTSTPVPQASTPPAPTPAPATTSPDPANDETALIAPVAGDEWHVDPTGRRYQLAAYPKSYAYRRLEGGIVRSVWGVDMEVEREDETNFYYRNYEADPNAKGPGPDLPEQTEELKASYVVDTPKVDRLGFVPFDQGLPRSGQWRNGLAVADMNGDGQLDIIHGPARKTQGSPVVFLGDGKGGWKRWNASYPDFPYDYGCSAVADLDADGRLDIVLGVHLRGLVAMVQTQPGHFELWNRGLPYRMGREEPLGFTSRAITIVDWNGDKRPDIAALSEGPQLQIDPTPIEKTPDSAYGLLVFLNQGDGSWKSVPAGRNGARGIFGDHLEAVDVDGDRRADLIASTNAQSRTDLLFYSGGPPGGRQGELDVRPAFIRSVAAADLVGDRKVEVATAFVSHELNDDWRTGIDLFEREGKAGWKRRLVWVEIDRQGIWSLAAGDVDGDRKRDLVGMTGDGRALVLLGDGRGGFALQDNDIGQKAPGCHGYALDLVDLDGDGRDEIVASFAGEISGLPGIYTEPGCPDGGSLRVWKSMPKPAG